MSLMTTGARPRLISSQSSTRGFDISARPIATICCWPPDSAVAGHCAPLAQDREELVDRVERPRSLASRLCGRRSAGSPRRERGEERGPRAPSRCRASTTSSARQRADRLPSKSIVPAALRARRRWSAAASSCPAPLAPMTATVSPSSERRGRHRTAPGSRRRTRSVRRPQAACVIPRSPGRSPALRVDAMTASGSPMPITCRSRARAAGRRPN